MTTGSACSLRNKVNLGMQSGPPAYAAEDVPAHCDRVGGLQGNVRGGKLLPGPDCNGRGACGIGNSRIIDRYLALFGLDDRKKPGLLIGFNDLLARRQAIDPELPEIVGPRPSGMGELALPVPVSVAEGRNLSSLDGLTIFVIDMSGYDRGRNESNGNVGEFLTWGEG